MKKYQYRRSRVDWIITILCGIGLGTILGVLFYRHIAGCLALCLFLPLYIRLDMKRREERYREELAEQFQASLEGMTGALQAGYSLERAVPYAAQQLTSQYPEKAPMVSALKEVSSRIGMGETAEQAFEWLAEEIDLAEIDEFVLVLTTAKRTGGNLIQVMLHTTDCLAMKRDVSREINTLIAGKRLEANLMNLLPPGILCYLWVSLPDLVGPLYGNLQGVLFMSVMLAAYGGSYIWTQKILQLKV